MIWLVVGSLVPSFLVSLSIASLIRRIGPKIGLVDHPGQHKAHAAPTPMGGGLAIWAGVVVPLAAGWIALMWSIGRYWSTPSERVPAPGSLAEFVSPHVDGMLQQAPRLLTLLAAATVLVVLGLIDDVRGLKWWLRFIVQWAMAAFIVSQGWRMSLFIDFPPVTIMASVIWIVTLINTFNMLDNMDGLAAGVAAIAAAILATVILTAPESFTQGPQLFVGGFLLVLVGSLGGFLWHNRPPAKLFMGDAGSYFVGFCLATTTISATFAGGNLPRHAILAPICVLAVPIYDTVTVIVIRLSEGRSPFSADRNHLSHRLVDLGLTKSQAVLVIYTATGVCGLGAFLLHKVNTLTAVCIIVAIVLLLAAIARVELAVRKRKKRKMTNS